MMAESPTFFAKLFNKDEAPAVAEKEMVGVVQPTAGALAPRTARRRAHAPNRARLHHPGRDSIRRSPPRAPPPPLTSAGIAVAAPSEAAAPTPAEETSSPEPKFPVGSVDPSELTKQYDLVVIGGGPAGVAGAVKAAQLGKRVLIVDKPKAAPAGGGLDFGFGGPTGLFSKALRDVGKTLDVDSMRTMGMDQDVIWGQVRNNCLRLAGNNANNVCSLLEDFRIGYLQGEATLSVLTPYAEQEGKHALSVKQYADGKQVDITTKKVLLCTGSKPTRVGSIPFDDVRIFDSDTVNGLTFLPKSVIIVGSGISRPRTHLPLRPPLPQPPLPPHAAHARALPPAPGHSSLATRPAPPAACSRDRVRQDLPQAGRRGDDARAQQRHDGARPHRARPDHRGAAAQGPRRRRVPHATPTGAAAPCHLQLGAVWRVAHPAAWRFAGPVALCSAACAGRAHAEPARR